MNDSQIERHWEELEREFGYRRHGIRPIEIKKLELPKESYADVLKKMNEGHKLTVEEIQMLPEHYQAVYYLQDDQVKEDREIMRRAKLRIAKEKRKARLEHEKHIHERAVRKMIAGIELLPYEKEIYNRYEYKLEDIEEPEVSVDATDILNDVVNGKYTLQDVDMIRKSSDIEPAQDDFQNSPIRLLDNVVENVKQTTHNLLQTTSSEHFFKSVDADVQSRVTPMKLNEIISSCATGLHISFFKLSAVARHLISIISILGIDMMRGSKFEENEARDACESFVKALAMYEGEVKIKNVVHDANKKQIEKETLRLAQVAAASAVSPNVSAATPSQNLSFNVTQQEMEFSFIPDEDPDVYKPLEIISYVGMTK